MTAAQDLFAAIESGETETVRALLSANPGLVDARNPAGLSAVLFATYRGSNEIAKLLIDRGVRLDIFEASATGTQDRVEQLLHKDSSLIHSYSVDGWTPLHLAVFFGRINIARILISNGADMNVLSKTEEHVAPIHSALANPHNAAVALLLIEHGADLSVTQSHGYTPLHYAAANGLEPVVKSLLARSANRDARDRNGKTPYDLAMERGQISVAALLKAS